MVVVRMAEEVGMTTPRKASQDGAGKDASSIVRTASTTSRSLLTLAVASTNNMECLIIGCSVLLGGIMVASICVLLHKVRIVGRREGGVSRVECKTQKTSTRAQEPTTNKKQCSKRTWTSQSYFEIIIYTVPSSHFLSCITILRVIPASRFTTNSACLLHVGTANSDHRNQKTRIKNTCEGTNATSIDTLRTVCLCVCKTCAASFALACLDAAIAAPMLLWAVQRVFSRVVFSHHICCSLSCW